MRTWGPGTDGSTMGVAHRTRCCSACFLSAAAGMVRVRSCAVLGVCSRDHSSSGSSWSGLVSLQMGFFKRAKHPEATVPQYHAVKIPREDRQQFKEEKTGTILRNNWGSPRREGPDAHPILAADGHPELGPDGHAGPGTA